MNNYGVEIKAHGLDWLENTRTYVTDDNDVIELNYIDLWGITYPDSTSCLLKFAGVEPYVYLQIPDDMILSEYDIENIKTSLTSPKKNEWPTPISAEFIRGKQLYYYGSPKINCFRVKFQTRKILNQFIQRYHKKSVYISGQRVYTKVWESSIDTIQKILTITGITHTSWFSVTAYPINELEKESTIDEYEADITTFKPIPLSICQWWESNPLLFAFDIECYSPVRGHLPVPVIGSNCMFIITVVTEQLGLPETRKKYAIVYGVCRPLPGVNLIIVKEEWGLIEEFCKLIREKKPHIITGYNINIFDIPFIDLRIKRRPTKKWPHISKFKPDVELVEGVTNLDLWYDREQEDVIKGVKIPGIVVIDTYHIAKAECRDLHRHRLNDVAEHLLGKQKEDIGGYENIFEAFEAYIKYIKLFRKLKASLPHITEEDEIDWTPELHNLHEIALDKMTDIVKYGVTDSDLLPDIWNRLDTWTGMIECCNVVNCNLRDYYSRGQQIKCMNQIFRKAAGQGFIMTRNEYTDGKQYNYEGGYVAPPDKGKHEPVVTLDFTSLYPSIMIWLNICYSTYVPPHMWDNVPLESVNRISIKGALKDKPDTVAEFRYVKKEVRYGILPQMVAGLLEARGKVKLEMKAMKDKKRKSVLNARQLGLKLSANATYGFTGVSYDIAKFPCVEVAMSVTGQGRNTIVDVGHQIEEAKYGKIIYGDSVTGNTPTIIRYSGTAYIIEIRKLENLIKMHTRADGKLEGISHGIEVWSDKGFTKINKFIKHKTNKCIYRVITPDGFVDVTEDHSLLDYHANILKPSEVIRFKTQLLTSNLPLDVHTNGINPYIISPDKFFICNSQAEALRYYAIANSLGYDVNIDFLINRYVILIKKRPQNKFLGNNLVLEIKNLGIIDDYVYDLETENHHFQAGVGKLVVHNTDSVFVRLWNIPKTEYARIPQIAKEMENYINKQFEGTVMHIEVERMLISFHKAKKQYACIYISKTGEIIFDIDKMYIKGMAPVRGDRIEILKEMLKQIVFRIIKGDSFKFVALYILDVVQNVLSGRVPAEKLYSIMKVGVSYKSDNARMKVFADKLRKSGRPVVPGEKLRFVTIVETHKDQKLGNRSVLDDVYEKDPDNYELDYKYYVRQNIAKQIDEIMEIAYGDIIDQYYGDFTLKAGACQSLGLRKMITMISKMIDRGYDDALQKTIDYIESVPYEGIIDPDLKVDLGIHKLI